MKDLRKERKLKVRSFGTEERGKTFSFGKIGIEGHWEEQAQDCASVATWEISPEFQKKIDKKFTNTYGRCSAQITS